MKPNTPRAELEALLRRGIEAVDAGAAVARFLERSGDGLRIAGEALPPGGRLVVAAIGKAAGPMAAAALREAGEWIDRGLVITKHAHAMEPVRLPVREAAHPIPDGRSEAAARELLDLVAGCTPPDTLLVLLSGGTSALTACPIEGVTLEEIAATTRQLLEAGADIEALNTVRRHLSAVGGGRLAQASRAGRIEVLAVSDVMGDGLDVIGSGPCAVDRTTWADAQAVLECFDLMERVPSAVRHALERGAAGELPETAKPGADALARVRSHIVARNADARRAIESAAREAGLEVFSLGESLRGEARDIGRRLAALAHALRPKRSSLLVAGGETVVTVSGPGRGGRNQELALAAAVELARRADPGEGAAEIALLAAGTDGDDGPTPAAGAYVDGETLSRGRERGVDAERALEENDSYGFFVAEGGCLETGPTGTNVMDLVLMRIEGSP